MEKLGQDCSWELRTKGLGLTHFYVWAPPFLQVQRPPNEATHWSTSWLCWSNALWFETANLWNRKKKTLRAIFKTMPSLFQMIVPWNDLPTASHVLHQSLLTSYYFWRHRWRPNAGLDLWEHLEDHNFVPALKEFASRSLGVCFPWGSHGHRRKAVLEMPSLVSTRTK